MDYKCTTIILLGRDYIRITYYNVTTVVICKLSIPKLHILYVPLAYGKEFSHYFLDPKHLQRLSLLYVLCLFITYIAKSKSLM